MFRPSRRSERFLSFPERLIVSRASCHLPVSSSHSRTHVGGFGRGISFLGSSHPWRFGGEIIIV